MAGIKFGGWAPNITAIAKILNLAVRYRIATCILLCKYEILAHFNLAVAKVDRQTAKFNSPPNFPAIRYGSILPFCMASDQFCPNSVVVIVIIIHTIAGSQDLGIVVVISAIKC